MNPLLPLATLSTNIKHAAKTHTLATEDAYFICGEQGMAMSESYALYAKLAHLKPCLVYARGFRSSSENIHLTGEIIYSDYSHDLLEEAA